MKNSTELIRFIARLANTIIKALEDGKITLKDAREFIRLLPVIRPAFDDLGEVWDEFRAMTDDDRAALKHVVCDELDLDPDDARAVKIANHAIEAALGLTQFVVSLKKLD